MVPALPERLGSLLAKAPSRHGDVLSYLAHSAVVLSDNKLPFFPAYTDHGVEHIERVLKATDRLVPADAWEVLVPDDAAAIVTASVLHDFAMHLREPGFVELVGVGSRFRPRPWFSEQHGSRTPDRPWNDLWQEFRDEVRRWTASQFTRVLGPKNAGVPVVCVGDNDMQPSTWTDEDRLVIGEFLRRHHARLAHEIAVYGLPGAGQDFPVLQDALGVLAEAAGAVARSHNEDLRLVADYFEDLSPGNLLPSGIHATYVMALLRIADYLQLDADRAPMLLLRLRHPQSPQSWEEWRKHRAIDVISWQHRDHRSVFFQVSSDHSLRTHLQLAALLDDLQRELDQSAAVLDESYAAGPTSVLRLGIDRVRSNLHEPSLLERLPYVPRHAALRSAEDLFRLVVRDLYGDDRAVAGRELVQNAVDGVRALDRWCEQRNVGRPSESLVESDSDVTAEIVELADDGVMALRVRDRGIGMTPATVIDYFLRAGASFEPVDSDDRQTRADSMRWLRAGRFGIGAFAAFLLGREVRVRTRHVTSARGVSFVARLSEDLVELRYIDMPVGTEVVVPIAASYLGSDIETSLAGSAEHELMQDIASSYALRTPSVDFTIPGAKLHGRLQVPVPGSRLPDSWRSIRVRGFDAIYWAVQGERWWSDSLLVHNGIVIRKPSTHWYGSASSYRVTDVLFDRRKVLRQPTLAVFDSAHRLGLNLTRDSATDLPLPFEDQLLADIGRDLVAYFLVAGPKAHPLATDWGTHVAWFSTGFLPFLPGLVRTYCARHLAVTFAPVNPNTWTLPARSTHTGAPTVRVSCRVVGELARADADLREGRSAEETYVLDVDETLGIVKRLLNGRFEIAGAAVVSLGGDTLHPHPLGDDDSWDPDALAGHFEWLPSKQTEMDEVAERLASPLLDGRRRTSVGCGVFTPTANDTPLSKVEEPWHQLVGGPMPRSARGRAKLAERLSSNRSFATLLNKWRRTLDLN